MVIAGCYISFAHDIGKQCRRNFAAAGQKKYNEKNNILIDSLDIVKKMRIMRTPVITGEIVNM